MRAMWNGTVIAESDDTVVVEGNHYFVNGGWMREGQLIEEVGRIRHIPAVIVQGRYDLACPAVTADDLHRAWPEADYRLVLAGHSAMEPAIAAELVAATDRFAG